ncbi:CU044_5270 family protein [Nonomuraea pusilla]|uniref:CU044_5270 family protein n=1 Tax=Nonomuraea pusilla TaxID=46177 RepID=UPI0033280C66
MDDEIRQFADGRPPAPAYRPEARARARELLLAEARGGGRFRLPRFGWQAVAAFGVTVALVGGVAVALSGRPQEHLAVAAGATESAAVAEPLQGDLNPRPGQFILVESDTMYAAMTVGRNGEESRHLYRTHRKIWQSVDGSADGLLLIDGREPRPWPGQELPEDVKDWQGSEWITLAACRGTQDRDRRYYTHLSTLPTDPAALRERLYGSGGDKDADRDQVAFTAAGDLVRETYLPKAQRDALFEAVKGIPGTEVAEGVEDSAGRKGVALGRAEADGTLTQLIFDPDTRMFLGERQTVVDEQKGQAPKGSVVALTAQLKVSVADRLPDEAATAERSDCPSSASAPVEPPTATPSLPPTVTEESVAPATVTMTATPVAPPTVTQPPSESAPAVPESGVAPAETAPASAVAPAKTAPEPAAPGAGS